MPQFEQALYYSAAPPTYAPHLHLFAACHSCLPLLHIHAVILNRMYFPNVLYSAHTVVTLLGRFSSLSCTFFTAEVRVLSFSITAAVYCLRGPGSGPRGGFWLQARGPRQQERNEVANNLQMLACIRAWQLVMSPPTLPHSSITSHLLPDTSWGRWWRIDAGRLWTVPPFSQEQKICHDSLVSVDVIHSECDVSIGWRLLVLTDLCNPQQRSAAPASRSWSSSLICIFHI